MIIDSARSILLCIDVQERLCPVVNDPRKVLANGARLMKGASLLDVPILVTEQYPQGIGPTMVDLRDLAPKDAILQKMTFSCAATPGILDRLRATGRSQVVVFGTEAHVCVLQSCLGLLVEGFEVFVVRDACSSRALSDEEAALERMAQAGVAVVTTEMALFEWIGDSSRPVFKAVHQTLIR